MLNIIFYRLTKTSVLGRPESEYFYSNSRVFCNVLAVFPGNWLLKTDGVLMEFLKGQ